MITETATCYSLMCLSCAISLWICFCAMHKSFLFYSFYHTAVKHFFYFQLSKTLRNWTTSMKESMQRGRPSPCRMCSTRVKIRSLIGTLMSTDGTQVHRRWYTAHVTPEPLQLSAHTGESFIRSPNSSCWDSFCFINRPHRCQYRCASLGSCGCIYIKAVVALVSLFITCMHA